MAYANVTIDAGILAIPTSVATQEDIRQYVEAILVWSKNRKPAWVGVTLSELASDALFKDDLFPLYDRLSTLFASKGIVEYDARTVAGIIFALLQLPSFEEHFSIREVYAENLSLDPDILQACSGIALRNDLARCVVLIAILRNCSRQALQDHHLLLRSHSARKVQVQAHIHSVKHERDDFIAWPLPPEYFEGDILLCEDFKGFIESLDEDAMLLHAPDDTAVEAAIRVAVFKGRVKSGASPDWESLPRFLVGAQFRTSFRKTRPTPALTNKILREAVGTLEKVNMRTTHALRRGSGGNDPQCIRGKDRAQAWRRDIDEDHHLHYWQCPGDVIEFASVNFPHDDFSIPE